MKGRHYRDDWFWMVLAGLTTFLCGLSLVALGLALKVLP